jgi:hypothetical protein
MPSSFLLITQQANAWAPPNPHLATSEAAIWDPSICYTACQSCLTQTSDPLPLTRGSSPDTCTKPCECARPCLVTALAPPHSFPLHSMHAALWRRSVSSMIMPSRRPELGARVLRTLCRQPKVSHRALYSFPRSCFRVGQSLGPEPFAHFAKSPRCYTHFMQVRAYVAARSLHFLTCVLPSGAGQYCPWQCLYLWKW